MKGGRIFGADDNKPKDRNLVVSDGQKKDITEGTRHILILRFPADMVDEKDIYFCFATHAVGNVSTTFDYEEIPETVVKPEPPPAESEYQITSITGQIGEQSYPSEEDMY